METVEPLEVSCSLQTCWWQPCFPLQARISGPVQCEVNTTLTCGCLLVKLVSDCEFWFAWRLQALMQAVLTPPRCQQHTSVPAAQPLTLVRSGHTPCSLLIDCISHDDRLWHCEGDRC